MCPDTVLSGTDGGIAMLKKRLFPLFLFCVLLFSLSAGALEPGNVTVCRNGTLTFSVYTDGAEAAFDGDTSTAYAGSVTGQFPVRSVISGITLRAASPIVNLTVSGSEDGVRWIPLYSREKVNSVCIFGYNGSSYTDSALNEMYTYALRYLRFELEYGSIAEIVLRGYEADLGGTVAALDASFGEGKGYDCSGSYYEDDRTTYLFDHIIGSADYGDAITYPDSTNKYAYLTVHTADAAPITAIALAHKSNDKNVTRWNGVKIEASEDGIGWTVLKTLPADFSVTNDLGQKTLFFLTVDPGNAYRYVRLSSTAASISIGSLDIYTQGESAEIPATVLSGWEGDPYVSEKKPTQSEETSDSAPAGTDGPGTVTDAPADGTGTAEPDGQNAGCGSSVSVVLPVLLLAGAPALLRKKRKR